MKEKFRWLLLIAAVYMTVSNMYETGIRIGNVLILLMIMFCFGVQVYSRMKKQKEEQKKLLEEEAERKAKRRAKRAGGAKRAAIRERQEEKKQERRERRRAMREQAEEEDTSEAKTAPTEEPAKTDITEEKR